MHPRQKRTLVRATEPVESRVDYCVAAALRFERRRRVVGIALDRVVVHLESALETEAMVEHERPDERRGAVAAPGKESGQRFPIGGKGSGAVDPNGVMQRE